MRILQVSKFLHYVGGVETYFRWLAPRQQAQGHDVAIVGMQPPVGHHLMQELAALPRWTTKTRSYEKGSPQRLRSAMTSMWSREAGEVMETAITDFRPDLIHFHGTCYQLTPAVAKAAANRGVPAVLTAHEYKLACANQTLYDDVAADICTACIGASRFSKVTEPLSRNCMKGSRLVTALGAAEGLISDFTWRHVDPVVLAPSKFMRRALIEDGWPPGRIEYLDLPWCPAGLSVQCPDTERNTVVFLGRLVALKGVHRLLNAWEQIHSRHPDVELRILGDGADGPGLVARASALPQVTFLGQVSPQTVRAELSRALLSVHPSQCHENSPYAVRESLMAGVPALVSDVGGMPDMVGPETGWVVPHDSDVAWAEGLSTAIDHARPGARALREAVIARATTEEDHLDSLSRAYDTAQNQRGTAVPPSRPTRPMFHRLSAKIVAQQG